MTDQKIISAEFNIFFDELGNIGTGGGLHLKLTALGNFDPALIREAIAAGLAEVQQLRDAFDKEAKPAQPVQDGTAVPVEEAPQRPPVEREQPRPSTFEWEGQSTDLKRIMAICHHLDSDSTEAYLSEFAGVEWKYDKQGACVPTWDWLQTLDKQQVNTITAKLRRMEQEQEARQRA